MNKLARTLTVATLCAALYLTGVGVVFAQTAEKTDNPPLQTTQNTQSAQTEVSKNETVYVLAGADGSVQKIIVSDWIQNALGSDTVSDKSQLSGIKNVKGNESYTLDEKNMTVWDAQGNDIYYQGTIEKALPVNMTVSYQLDGKSVSADELSGKSGKVTIRFDYKNNQYEMVEIDGKQEKIYVPFAMLTGMMLDSNTFRNVEVSNGKLLNDGDHTIVVGLAFPGLQENLNIRKETLEIPEYVEITADVTDFSFGMTVTLATNEIFNALDTENFDLSDVDGSLRKLTNAMTQLLDGSSDLYDGLCTLLQKSNELVAGVKELASGAKSLKDGADRLNDGASKLVTGAEKLSAGLNTLSSNSAGLNSGAEEVFNSLLSTATTQIRTAGITIPDLTIENYATVLNQVIASLDETTVYNQALQQVTTAVEAKRPEITEKVTAAVRNQIMQQVLQNLGMTIESYDAAVAAGQVSEEQQSQIEATIAAQLATTEVQSTIAQGVEAQVQQAISENMRSDAIQSQLATASAGCKTIIDLKASLDSYRTFYLGVLSYTSGVDDAASGADDLSAGAVELKDGTDELDAGAAKLCRGVLTLQDDIPSLVSGVTQLRDGAMSLSDGLRQFYEEGIQTLVDRIEENLDGVVVRLKATVDVSKNYTNFAGIGDGMDGQVKFIYRTEEIQSK